MTHTEIASTMHILVGETVFLTDTIEYQGRLFVYISYVWMYVCHFVLLLLYFFYMFDPIPNFTEQNPLVIDH